MDDWRGTNDETHLLGKNVLIDARLPWRSPALVGKLPPPLLSHKWGTAELCSLFSSEHISYHEHWTIKRSLKSTCPHCNILTAYWSSLWWNDDLVLIGWYSKYWPRSIFKTSFLVSKLNGILLSLGTYQFYLLNNKMKSLKEVSKEPMSSLSWPLSWSLLPDDLYERRPVGGCWPARPEASAISLLWQLALVTWE